MTTPHRPGPLLAGKTALVTGGGAGIGGAISEAFAAHGARVHLAEIDADRAARTVAAIEGDGGWARAHVLDVTAPESSPALASAVGAVDILVHNVGDYLFRGVDFAETTPDQWEALHRVNFAHVLSVTQAFLPGMIAAGRGGSIIALTTVEAFRAVPMQPVYAAYKAATGQFVKSLAVQVGRHGIRVNAIAPDVTQSEQLPYDRWIPEDQRPLIPTWVPLGRFGTADDQAGAALFLASELSAFVTGTTIHTDGGTYAAGGWYPSARGGWTNRPLAP